MKDEKNKTKRVYPNPVINFIRTKPIPKLFSLIGAILLSFYVAYQEDEVREYSIPIVVKNLPDELAVSSQKTKEATLILKGQRSKLLGLNPKSVDVYADLKKAQRGKGFYEVRLDTDLPQGIRARVSPTTVEIHTENKESRWIGVVASLVGSPPPGYYLIKYEIIPDEVEVSGAPSVIKNIKQIITEGVSLGKVIESSSVNASLVSIDHLEFGIKSVSVLLEVGIVTEKQTLHAMIPATVGLKKNFAIENPEEILVRELVIEGPQSKIRSLSVKNISIVLNLKDIDSAGLHTNRVPTIELPKDIKLISVTPPSFDILVSHRK